MKLVKRFIKEEKGLESSEYALLLALIAIALVATISVLKESIAAAFTATSETIDTSVTEAQATPAG